MIKKFQVPSEGVGLVLIRGGTGPHPFLFILEYFVMIKKITCTEEGIGLVIFGYGPVRPYDHILLREVSKNIPKRGGTLIKGT